MFLEASGRNRTPDRLPVAERKPLLRLCDRGLRRTVETLRPRWVVGIGRFAEQRARHALRGTDIGVGGVLHPSPASPAANRNWQKHFVEQLSKLGIEV